MSLRGIRRRQGYLRGKTSFVLNIDTLVFSVTRVVTKKMYRYPEKSHEKKKNMFISHLNG